MSKSIRATRREMERQRNGMEKDRPRGATAQKTRPNEKAVDEGQSQKKKKDGKILSASEDGDKRSPMS